MALILLLSVLTFVTCTAAQDSIQYNDARLPEVPPKGNKCLSLKDGFGNTYFVDCTLKTTQICGKDVNYVASCCAGFQKVDGESEDCMWQQNLFRPFWNTKDNDIDLPDIKINRFMEKVRPEILYYKPKMLDGNAFTMLVVNNFENSEFNVDALLRVKCYKNRKIEKDDPDYKLNDTLSCETWASNKSPNAIEYLIGRGRLYTQNVFDGMTFDTWYGGDAKWKIQKYANNIFTIDCAIIQFANYEFEGGVMHIIDRPIFANKANGTKRETIISFGQDDPDVMEFINDMPKDIQEFLGTPYCQAWYTVFVPVASAAKPAEVNYLDYIVKNMFCSAAFTAARKLRTLSGLTLNTGSSETGDVVVPSSLSVNVGQGNNLVTINKGQARDIVVGNGVIHKMAGYWN